MVPPHDVSDVGRICVVSDPTGAIAHLLQPIDASYKRVTRQFNSNGKKRRFAQLFIAGYLRRWVYKGGISSDISVGQYVLHTMRLYRRICAHRSAKESETMPGRRLPEMRTKSGQ